MQNSDFLGIRQLSSVMDHQTKQGKVLHFHTLVSLPLRKQFHYHFRVTLSQITPTIDSHRYILPNFDLRNLISTYSIWIFFNGKKNGPNSPDFERNFFFQITQIFIISSSRQPRIQKHCESFFLLSYLVCSQNLAKSSSYG